jgi:hypothetical protein
LISLETQDAGFVYNGKMTDTKKLENRAIINFCCNLEMTPVKILKKSAGEQRK